MNSRIINQLKKNVLTNVDKQSKINELVNIISCFYPGIKSAQLSDDEIRKLLTSTYQKLKKSGFVHLVEKSSFEVSQQNAESTSKKMRMKLLQNISAFNKINLPVYDSFKKKTICIFELT